MYFVSGWVMIMEGSFPRETIEEIKEIKIIQSIQSASDTELVDQLQDHFDLSGQYVIQKNDRRTRVTFNHPGTNAEVIIPNNTDSVIVTTREGNKIAVLQGYHRLHGYRGGWNYYLWAFMYDLSALSMIVFALSGFYLWYKMERNHRVGWLIFGGFSTFTASIIIYLMLFS